MNKSKITKIGIVCGVSLLGVLTGCVGYVDGPRAGVYAPAPAVYVESPVVVEDDYVYYPAYQVYYSSNQRQYVYRDGRSWVSRPAPPRVSADVLFASPSVRVDFHDSPANHHAQVVKQYPKQWTPAESNRSNQTHDRGDDNRKN